MSTPASHPRSWRLAQFFLGLVLLGDLFPALFPARSQSASPGPAPRVRQFPVGSLRSTADLPDGPFRRRLEALPEAHRSRSLAWLRSFHFTEQDLPALRFDTTGGLYYFDAAPAAAEVPATSPSPSPAPAAASAPIPVSPFPTALRFHSRPGAPNVLFLNFAGDTITGTEWNTVVNRTSIPAVPYSTDADLTTYSDLEQQNIRTIWERVAEDYAPFNIDVTTERPATFTTRTAQALITRHTDANGAANPESTAGGIGYVNVFGTTSYARYRPVWIYHDNLLNDESLCGEAASHEVGHNLGLSHDGLSTGSEYYGGHGVGDISWGPIMGTGYYRNVSQWSKGEYYQASNTEDDLAIIAAKIAYRTDDVGNTPGTAKALVTTGQTNIVATTPATDPTNSQPANKGVIERGTDVDVFSFSTGAGTVSLTVSPWVVPGGLTHGGNLDLRLELRDDRGQLIASSNPDTQTDATVTATVAQGRYYLSVSNAAAGSPLSSTPSGYTSYGSLGQYFINGFTAPGAQLNFPPVAELQATNLTRLGLATYNFTVTYSDDVAVKLATLDSSDLLVSGPNGFSRAARFVSVNSTTDGTPRVATYALDAPNGTGWSPADNGAYTVALQSGQVSDTQGAFAPAGTLGQFTVAVPVPVYAATLDSNPGWTLDPDWQYGTPNEGRNGPSAGFTGTKVIGYNLNGSYANNLSAKYATTPVINASGTTALTLSFQRWLRVRNNDPATIDVSTNGTQWTRLWTSAGAISDTAWREMQYPLPAAFAGSPTLQIRWGLASNPNLTELGWNLDDIRVLGNGALDSTPPTAKLAIATLTDPDTPSQPCTVTYTDPSGVALASLDAADLIVRGPNGYTGPVEFVGADLPSDGSPLTASYSIPGPGGSWDPTDNGTYQLVLVGDEVTDVNGNGIPETVLGSFEVKIATGHQALVVDPLALDVPEGGQAGFTVRLTEAPTNTVTFTTVPVLGDPTVTVKSGATLSFDASNWSTPVTVTLAAAVDADNADSTATFEVRSAGLTSISVVATKRDLPPGVLGVSPATGLAAAGPVGGPFTPDHLTCTLTNSGGLPLNWSVTKAAPWLDLSAPGGTLAPGATATVTLSFNAQAQALGAADYSDTVTFANTTDGSGTTTRPVSLGVSATPTVLLNVSVNEPAWGTVNPGSGGFAQGTSLSLTATPAQYFSFQEWRGDVSSTANPLPLVLSGSRSVEAVFAEVLTVNHPTPLWWLAAHGYTTDFENAVNQTGANGVPLWQSYLAGLDPADPDSRFLLHGAPTADGLGFALTWSTISNRLYTVLVGTGAPGAFTPLPGAIDLPWTTKALTDPISPGEAPRLYQLQVRKP